MKEIIKNYIPKDLPQLGATLGVLFIFCLFLYAVWPYSGPSGMTCVEGHDGMCNIGKGDFRCFKCEKWVRLEEPQHPWRGKP